MADDRELLGCPFCGAPPHYSQPYNKVQCANRNCKVMVVSSQNGAVEAWNARVQPKHPLIVELEEAAVKHGERGQFFQFSCLLKIAENDSLILERHALVTQPKQGQPAASGGVDEEYTPKQIAALNAALAAPDKLLNVREFVASPPVPVVLSEKEAIKIAQEAADNAFVGYEGNAVVHAFIDRGLLIFKPRGGFGE